MVIPASLVKNVLCDDSPVPAIVPAETLTSYGV